MCSDAPRRARRFAVASAVCALIAACSRSEPSAPISDASQSSVLVQPRGDIDAAIAQSRAALRAIELQRVDYAGASADLIEEFINEDPQRIGEVLTRVAQSLPNQFNLR
jgi:hypothetical protein